MSSLKLKDRVISYMETADSKLLSKLPLIIMVNGRGFSKVTTLLEKPYSNKLSECFYSTLVKLVQEIDGSVFGYQFNDEIIIVARNDQSLDTLPWYNNSTQKIASVTSSIATLQFNNYAAALDLNLMGDPIFYSHAFVVPDVTEAINVIVSKQQQAIMSSINFSCFYELLKKYHKNDIREMLTSKSVDDKINLLQQECSVDYNKYPLSFRRGVACYRTPKIISFEGSEIIKNKWTLNMEIPIFTKEHSFLGQIFKSGTDILRKDTD